MYGIKAGAKNFNQNPSPNFKADNTQRLSATEKDKVLGDKDLGEHLNKIADPNWIDPEKTRRVGNSDLDKDAFLKLFLAQLKNQDPMNPMESHELAAQLAQFTSLEKLNNIDTGINALNKAKNPKTSFEALNLIGKVVATDSSRIIRTDENEDHSIEFDIMKKADKAQVEIKDALGMTVRKLEALELEPGVNKIKWDGRLENGTLAQPGEYKVVIDAKGPSGKVGVKTGYEGKVTGVNFTAKGAVLLVGDQSIPMSDVKKIVDPTIQAHDRKVNEAKAVSVDVPQGAKPAANAAPSAGMGSNLESVGMSQGLINNLTQQAKGGS